MPRQLVGKTGELLLAKSKSLSYYAGNSSVHSGNFQVNQQS